MASRRSRQATESRDGGQTTLDRAAIIGCSRSRNNISRNNIAQSYDIFPKPLYTAAIYAARAMLEPILIQGIQPGGQLTITTDVENYPGFADVIQGSWLMEQMQKQAEHVGTRIVTDHVNDLDLTQRPFRLTRDFGDVFIAEHRGARDRRAGALARSAVRAEVQGSRRVGLRHLRRLLLQEQGSAGDRRRQHRGRGSAVPDQLRLQGDDCARRDSFRAEKILQDRLFKNPKLGGLDFRAGRRRRPRRIR